MRRFSGLATLMHLPENLWASTKHGLRNQNYQQRHVCVRNHDAGQRNHP